MNNDDYWKIIKEGQQSFRDGKFLPDGGVALWMKKVRLPKFVVFTTASIINQPLTAQKDGCTAISHDCATGYMFTFDVPMSPEEFVEHMNTHSSITLTNFRIGRKCTAATGEEFRPLICDVVYDPK